MDTYRAGKYVFQKSQSFPCEMYKVFDGESQLAELKVSGRHLYCDTPSWGGKTIYSAVLSSSFENVLVGHERDKHFSAIAVKLVQMQQL